MKTQELMELNEHKKLLRELSYSFSKEQLTLFETIRSNILKYKTGVLLKGYCTNQVITLDEINLLTEHLFYTGIEK